jgi:hypothetical protein
MRQVLVDQARRRRNSKRGAEKISIEDTVSFPPARGGDIGELDDALTAPAAFDEGKVKVIGLRFFGGARRPAKQRFRRRSRRGRRGRTRPWHFRAVRTPAEWKSYICSDPPLVNSLRKKLFPAGMASNAIYSYAFLRSVT